jgi:hypothetical protein
MREFKIENLEPWEKASEVIRNEFIINSEAFSLDVNQSQPTPHLPIYFRTTVKGYILKY